MEEAILNLTKLVGTFVEAQKTINAQLSQKIDTMENNVNKRIDGLQSEIEHKFDNLQCSISKLAQQHDHQVEEQCQQQGSFESLHIRAAVYPWEKNEEILPLLTEEVVEECQDHNLPLPPNSVHILPSPAAQPLPEEPAPAAEAKTIPSPLPALQNLKKLVAIVQTFVTTSKKMAVAYVAWHSGWFGCWFGFREPEPRHC